MKKLSIKFTICMMLLISILSACGTKASKDLPIHYIEVSYVIDIENPREVVGFGDYVFVAKVIEETETIHRNVEWIHFKKTSMPYTVYSITVIENLKGNIKKNIPIEIERFGGVNIDNDSISLPRGDVLLEAGAYYIFIASSDHDGSLGQAAPTAAIKLDVESENEIISSEEYKDYIKYCEEEIVFGRQRFKSRYEETISGLENEQKQLQDRNDQIRSEASVLKQELMKVNLSDSWNELWGDIVKDGINNTLSSDQIVQVNEVVAPTFTDTNGNLTVNPISCFFTSYYNSPEDIDFANFLRYFPYHSDVIDVEEFNSLKSQGNWPFAEELETTPVPIHRYFTEDVEKVLSEFAGIKLEDLNGVGLDELLYLEDYSAYYNFTSDFGPGTFNCTSGEVTNGTIKLYEEQGIYKVAVLTLEKQNGRYVIISHQVMEEQ